MQHTCTKHACYIKVQFKTTWLCTSVVIQASLLEEEVAQGIQSKLRDLVKRVDHIPLALGHLEI